MTVTGGACSDIGTYRDENQDRLMYGIKSSEGESFAIAAVCDGVGGAEKGGVAAQIVISGAEEWYRGISSWLDPAAADGAVVLSHLKDAAEDWNLDVRTYREENGVVTATTMSVLMILRDEFYALHVGDSRVYRYDGRLRAITDDEVISSEAGDGQTKQLLDNYMGKADELSFRQYTGSVKRRDLVLLCSDGFYHCLSEEDAGNIYRESMTSGNLADIASKWVGVMEARGERDNVSLGLIYVR